MIRIYQHISSSALYQLVRLGSKDQLVILGTKEIIRTMSSSVEEGKRAAAVAAVNTHIKV